MSNDEYMENIKANAMFNPSGFLDDDGFYNQPDGSFFNPDGDYFNADGYHQDGGYYDENGNYINENSDEEESKISENADSEIISQFGMDDAYSVKTIPKF